MPGARVFDVLPVCATRSGAEARRPGAGAAGATGEALAETALQSARDVESSAPFAGGELLQVAVPVRGTDGRPLGAVVVSTFSPAELLAEGREVQERYTKFRKTQAFKEPIKAVYLSIYALAALLILFGAVWLSMYLARRITVPLRLVSEGAERIASGERGVRVDFPAGNDEFAALIGSFNRMSERLKHSEEEIELSRQGLARKNRQLAGMDVNFTGGGHTGSVPTTLLLPQVVDAVDAGAVAGGGCATCCAICRCVSSARRSPVSSMRRCVVLLLTGAFEPFDQERAARVQSDGFLAKPFDRAQLQAAIGNHAATGAAPGASVDREASVGEQRRERGARGPDRAERRAEHPFRDRPLPRRGLGAKCERRPQGADRARHRRSSRRR